MMDTPRENSTHDSGVWLLDRIMNQMNAGVYITDVDTDEILFMNSGMKKQFGLVEPEGKICWQVLQKGMSGRCPFCPVPRLLRDGPSAAPLRWEEHNTSNGCIYENFDSLIQWHDGRLVHFQHSLDVTEYHKLSIAATTDELTGALNRRAGKAALAEMAAACARTGEPFSLCMFDVNDLKKANDHFGHAAGDQLLVSIAEAVRGVLQEGDVLCRLSGDEFLALMRGAPREQAVQRMNTALAALHGVQALSEQADAFSFGVLTPEPNGPARSVAQLLSDVDEKLHEKKRRLHIANAQYALLHSPQRSPGVDFTYDTIYLLDALVQSTDDYVYVCNMKTGVFCYPQAMVDEFDLPGRIIANAAAVWGAKVHPNDKQAFLEANQEITDGRADSHCVEYRACNRHGEWVWMRCRGHLERDAGGEPVLFAGIITNLGKKNKVDHLTGVFNKFEFEHEVRRLLDAQPREGVCVLLFGIDGLKRINGLYNRLFGDEVIRIVCQKLQTLAPPGGTVFRLDGDEFGVVLRGGTLRAVQGYFGAVQQAFSTQQTFDGSKFFCTLSCGCAFAPHDGTTYLGLLKCASSALDHAKRHGKNRMEVFSSAILGPAERAMELTELLRESIENGCNGFSLHYQPVFSPDGRLCGAEALSRWQCARFGSVPPGEFIALLEKNGMILSFGRWAFRQAVRQCAVFLDEYPAFSMAVNLSCLQLEDPTLVEYLAQTLREEGVSAEHIIVELTESYLAPNLERLSGLLAQMRGLGLRVAMDDFGTGYSSLSVLKHAPVDIVKIDRSFVQGLCGSAFDHSFVHLMVELCHSVGIRVCVEGVETTAELAALQPFGADYLQGFLLGHPEPAARFAPLFL